MKKDKNYILSLYRFKIFQNHIFSKSIKGLNNKKWSITTLSFKDSARAPLNSRKPAFSLLFFEKTTVPAQSYFIDGSISRKIMTLSCVDFVRAGIRISKKDMSRPPAHTHVVRSVNFAAFRSSCCDRVEAAVLRGWERRNLLQSRGHESRALLSVHGWSRSEIFLIVGFLRRRFGETCSEVLSRKGEFTKRGVGTCSFSFRCIKVVYCGIFRYMGYSGEEKVLTQLVSKLFHSRKMLPKWLIFQSLNVFLSVVFFMRKLGEKYVFFNDCVQHCCFDTLYRTVQHVYNINFTLIY